MSGQEPVKVYELAKELGMDSFSLLDKLRILNIPVKSHMSDLGDNEVRIVRSSLKKGGESDKTAAKKAAPKMVAKPRIKKKAAEPAAVATAQPAVTDEKKSAAPIIRRRVKADGSTETVQSTHVASPTQKPVSGRLSATEQPDTDQMDASHLDQPEQHYEQHEEVQAEEYQPDQPDLNGEQQEQDLNAASGEETAKDTHVAEGEDHHKIAKSKLKSSAKSDHVSEADSISETSALSDGSEVEQRLISTPISAPISAKEASLAAKEPKKEAELAKTKESGILHETKSHASPGVHGAHGTVSKTAAPTARQQGEPAKTVAKPQQQEPARPKVPIVLTPRPVAPRKSILKIVEATPPPQRPVIKPAAPVQTASKPIPKSAAGATSTGQEKDGFRIIKMTKENLDQMVEEEAAKKRGSGKELEIRPEDVRFADYRKKEMVFLPKKKKLPIGKEIKKTQLTVAKAQKRVVEMQEMISIQDLANQLSVKATDVVRKLIGLGQMATINQSVDFDTASLVANEYQYEVKNVAFQETALLATEEDLPEQLKSRPPIVTIMGHVDHGKTTLLDSIREANVAAGEAGGITQHIGAYTVEKNGKQITFIDTPGHEAFTVMRARGANVTDIVVLVVSADDGVMPQTREALSHAQAAKVPVIVAINKIDKPGANPEKIKQGLSELNLLAEDWGGDTIFVPVSALKKTNIPQLLDAILLQAEMLDLKANPEGLVSGVVLEARLERGRGPVISCLVKRGTLRVGDPIVSGSVCGKVKAMKDDKGRIVKETTPGFAVEVLGFEGVPAAGDKFNSTESENDARNIAENRIDKNREKVSAAHTKVSLEDLFSKIQAGSVKELNVILKADVVGSMEAIRDSLNKLSTEKVKIKIIHMAPGGITESDVLLASASGGIIIGFNVRPETKARQLAEGEHIEIKCYSIIYELIDDVKNAMIGLLDKKKVEKFLGRAEVRQIFTVPKLGVVAGSAVIDGKILRGANLRLLRDSRIIFDGKMASLRRFKEDAKEVATGFECGIGIENYSDIKPGDVIEAYQIEMVTPGLNE